MTSPTQAALGVNELLEAILLALPGPDITRLMTVCKTWHKVIDESSRLRHVRILQPLPPTSTAQQTTTPPTIWTPTYLILAHMRLNPVFGTACDYFDDSGADDPPTTRLFIYPANLPRLKTARHEFATRPPCTTLLLETYGRARPCTVYVPRGIRIGDLLDGARMLCRSAAWDAPYACWVPKGKMVAEDAIGKLVGCSTASSQREAEVEFEEGGVWGLGR